MAEDQERSPLQPPQGRAPPRGLVGIQLVPESFQRFQLSFRRFTLDFCLGGQRSSSQLPTLPNARLNFRILQ